MAVDVGFLLEVRSSHEPLREPEAVGNDIIRTTRQEALRT